MSRIKATGEFSSTESLCVHSLGHAVARASVQIARGCATARACYRTDFVHLSGVRCIAQDRTNGMRPSEATQGAFLESALQRTSRELTLSSSEKLSGFVLTESEKALNEIHMN